MDKIYISAKAFPASEEQRAYLEECAGSGTRASELIWRAPEEMTDEDYAQASATLGFFPPEKFSLCKKLEWVQLSSAGADLFTRPGVLPENCVLTNGSGALMLYWEILSCVYRSTFFQLIHPPLSQRCR